MQLWQPQRERWGQGIIQGMHHPNTRCSSVPTHWLRITGSKTHLQCRPKGHCLFGVHPACCLEASHL